MNAGINYSKNGPILYINNHITLIPKIDNMHTNCSCETLTVRVCFLRYWCNKLTAGTLTTALCMLHDAHKKAVRIKLYPFNYPMFKPSWNFLAVHSKVVILLWIFFFIINVSCLFLIILSCLFLAALCSPAGKWLTSWLSCMLCFLVFLSLSDVVSRVRWGTWLCQFLILAFFTFA